MKNSVTTAYFGAFRTIIQRENHDIKTFRGPLNDRFSHLIEIMNVNLWWAYIDTTKEGKPLQASVSQGASIAQAAPEVWLKNGEFIGPFFTQAEALAEAACLWSDYVEYDRYNRPQWIR